MNQGGDPEASREIGSKVVTVDRREERDTARIWERDLQLDVGFGQGIECLPVSRKPGRL